MTSDSPTVVLVHGAWADESSWAPVAHALRQNSIKTVTISVPLSTLADDVAAVDKALSSIDGPAVLVGHAYAGAVIAAVNGDKVKALVYVAALAPDEGETVAEVFNRYGHDDVAPELKPDEQGWIWLPRDAFGTAFAQNGTAEQQQALAAAQRPISPACITVPVGAPLWKRVPAWYLLAQRDHMIPEKTQRFMAERMNARISAWPVDHVPSITAPARVVEVITDALRAIAH